MVVSFASKTSVVGTVGVGFKYRLSSHWGLRADVRDCLGDECQQISVDTNPNVALIPDEACGVQRCEGMGVSSSRSRLGLIFYDNDRQGFSSSLSAPPLHGFQGRE